MGHLFTEFRNRAMRNMKSFFEFADPTKVIKPRPFLGKGAGRPSDHGAARRREVLLHRAQLVFDD